MTDHLRTSVVNSGLGQHFVLLDADSRLAFDKVGSLDSLFFFFVLCVI